MKTINEIFQRDINFDATTAEKIYLGMGCFWGAEKLFWKLNGVLVTAVGYAAGSTENPTYEDVCYGDTNHAEVVKVVYDPNIIELYTLLKEFWEGHNPTQGMRQGNDIGTQYRSIILTEDKKTIPILESSKQRFQKVLDQNSGGKIKTEIKLLKKFYLAEDYHQKYLHKNPNGYCGLKGLGCSYT